MRRAIVNGAVTDPPAIDGPVAELRERLGQIEDLSVAAGVLGWDQQTMMPPRGAEVRAESLATLAQITHDLFVTADMGRLLDAAQAALNGADPDSDDIRLVQVTRRRWEKRRRVPATLAAELARAGSLGQEAWTVARRENDFTAFAPYLQRNLDLLRRYIECFEGFDCAYDVLLDDYEPQMKTAEVARLFGELRAELPLRDVLRDHRRRQTRAPWPDQAPHRRDKPVSKLVLVTDSLKPTELHNCPLFANREEVYLKDELFLRKSDDVIAGSSLTMIKGLQNLVKFGIPLENAIEMASSNPSRIIGLGKRGLLVPGFEGDVIVFDDNYDILTSVAGGRFLNDFLRRSHATRHRTDYEAISKWAANHIARRINEATLKNAEGSSARNFVLGLPTGSSPIGTIASS